MMKHEREDSADENGGEEGSGVEAGVTECESGDGAEQTAWFSFYGFNAALVRPRRR